MLTVFFRISIFPVRSPSSLSVAVTSFSGSNSSPTVSVLSSAWMTGTSFSSSGFGFIFRFNVTFNISCPLRDSPQSYRYSTGCVASITVNIPLSLSNFAFFISITLFNSIPESKTSFILNFLFGVSKLIMVFDLLTFKLELLPTFSQVRSQVLHIKESSIELLLTSNPLISVLDKNKCSNFPFLLVSNSVINVLPHSKLSKFKFLSILNFLILFRLHHKSFKFKFLLTSNS